MRASTSAQARGAACGLAAAALFGLSAPVAKVLLAAVSPVLLAGLLYGGAALGLWLHRAVSAGTREAGLSRGDAPRLAAIVCAGGVVGPVLMLLGLSRVTALAGSLLLNLEAPFTVLLAVAFFGEHLGRSAAAAVVLIAAGAALLEAQPGALGADMEGVLLLVGACACWAVDNNLTQGLSLKDPFAIVRVKTLVAGLTNGVLGLAIARGALPPWPYVLGALVLGSLSYGVSVVLDAFALRLVGAAREAAYFATAPFVGAIASLLLLGDPIGAAGGVAMALMACGVALLLRERHSHEHTHEEAVHEHIHVHDAHHQHTHGPDDPISAPHSHAHSHVRLVHTHPHVPDLHHRHEH